MGPGTVTTSNSTPEPSRFARMLAPFKRVAGYRPGKPTLIIVGSVFVVVAMVMTRPSEVPEPRRERAWAVEVIEAQPAEISPTLELFGRVQSPQDAELSASIEAVIMQMLVRDGEAVAEGQQLLTLDDRDAALELKQYEADLKEAGAQRNFARIRLDRSKQAYGKEQELLQINRDRADRAAEIFAEGLLSKADMDTANENLARQQLAVNQAELTVEENSARIIELDARIARLTAQRDRAALDMERTRVVAPFAGVISDLQVSEGDRVRVGDTLMRLQNPDSIEVRAQIPSRIARTITEGMQEGISISALVETDSRTIPGTLQRVSGQTREGSGGVDSFIGFDSVSTAGLRLGSTVRIVLEMPAEPNVIAVPGEAIYGRDRLYKRDGERMKMVMVERVGEREYADGRTEVLVRTPELANDDEIIVTKLANATDGLLIETTPTRVSGNSDPSAATMGQME